MARKIEGSPRVLYGDGTYAKEIPVSETEHDDTKPEVEVHRFAALDSVFDDDDEPVEVEVDEGGDGEDVRLHGMSDFG